MSGAHAITVPFPETGELRSRSDLILSRAQSLVIDSPGAFEQTSQDLKLLRAHRQRIKEAFEEPKRAAHAAHKAVVDAIKEHDSPLLQAETIIMKKLRGFRAEQERVRREKEQAIRKEREAQQLAEQERQAALLKQQGREEEARAVEDAPIVVAPPTLPPEVPEVKGVQYRKIWKWRLLDAEAVPRQWLMLNEKLINAHVRATKGATRIPGIEVYEDDTVAVSAKEA